MMGGQSINPFKWNPRRLKAAYGIAEGLTVRQAAEDAGLKYETVRKWKEQSEDFRRKLDELSLEVGIAERAARARFINRVVAQFVREFGVKTDRDVLDWVKEMRLTVDGDRGDTNVEVNIFDIDEWKRKEQKALDEVAQMEEPECGPANA